ncbi:MAG: ankyrin repeat domain-containing protein [Burkholderiaceae bacterium]|jgi:ankyrin repeat protein|nr:ankyrin repeat domain-containing protein [Burkholderiaceae bacterium]
MRQRLFAYIPALLAIGMLLSCASRNDVCKTCIDRTDERLMDAAAELYPDAVRRILDEGADVNAKDQYGETPLMKALRQPDSRVFERMRPMAATVGILLDEGADIDVVSKRGADTLKLAQETGNVDIIRLFDRHMTQADRDQMFMRTLAAGQYDAALYLLRAGANPSLVNAQHQSALHLSVNSATPDPELVALLVKTNDVHSVDAYGTTPIMTACAHGAPVEIVSLLIDNGSGTNGRFNKGSLLYLALTAKQENVQLVKYLLNHGLSANDAAPDGTPLLVLAARADRIRSALALTAAGADVSVLDNYGEKAWHSRLSALGV